VARSWKQFGIQAICAGTSATFSVIVTFLLVKAMSYCFPPLKTYDEQESARDAIGHGETAYYFETLALGKSARDDDDDSELETPSTNGTGSGGYDKMSVLTPRESDRITTGRTLDSAREFAWTKGCF